MIEYKKSQKILLNSKIKIKNEIIFAENSVGRVSAKNIYISLKSFYKQKKFIKFAKFNTPISTGDVMNTNICKISVCNDRKKNSAIIFSAIDNLIKGGSGQAMQNMNLLFGFSEHLGFK